MSSTLICSPCENVRKTCKEYATKEICRNHVTIDTSAIQPLAEQILAQAGVQWDEEDWHYHCPDSWPVSIRNERIAAYILALDAINFCFWPSETGYEYVDVATTLTTAAHADHEQQQCIIDQGKTHVSPDFVLSATHLLGMSVEKMTTLFDKHHTKGWLPPDMEMRCTMWNEVGAVLLDKFNGSAWLLILSANQSAPALVQLLVENFPNFRDAYSNLYFYKRAQICVGDWNAALLLNLKHMETLTTFADYRVPQLLRHCDILVYSAALAATVDDKGELLMGSDEELAIRATTVAAVELLVAQLTKDDDSSAETSSIDLVKWNAVNTDWYLWQVGERMQAAGQLLPHHRVRTIFY